MATKRKRAEGGAKPRRRRSKRNPATGGIDAAREGVRQLREDAENLREATTGLLQEVGALAGEASQVLRLAKDIGTAFSILMPKAAKFIQR